MAELKKAGIQMQKPSSTSTSSQGYKAPKQRFNRPHFAKPYARTHGQFATQKEFFSQQPGAKGCPHQTTHSNPEGSMKDKVREKVSSIVNAELLSQLVLNLKAGCVKEHITNWKEVTTDPVILDAIQHHHIEFEGHCRPVQATQPRQIIFSSADKDIINLEIAKLLTKGVIEPSKPSDGDFISTIFVRPKKDGSHRLILKLKPLNEFVAYYHFKIDTIHAALKLMRPGCFMASVDLKDAYYSIPISVEDRNFLKFEWQGNYFRFTCLPNGLASAPRLFTKVLKPIYAHLRSLGHFCMGHIDDSFLMGHTYTSCRENIWETTNTFLKLGFVIHPTKSVLTPTQELEFLGFLLNSNSMTIRLPPRKAITVKQACENLLNQSNPTIREVARVIGLLVSSLPGVQFGELHYRHLERNKISALTINKGDYDALMSLSAKAVLEITVGHRTLSDQILKMSGQLHIMIGHDDRTCHQHILSSLLQGVVSQ